MQLQLQNFPFSLSGKSEEDLISTWCGNHYEQIWIEEEEAIEWSDGEMKNPLKNHKGFKDRKKKRVKNKLIKSATNIMHSQTNPVKQHDQMLFKQSSDLDHKITAFSQTPQ